MVEISIWSLFTGASFLVKCIMCSLLLVSFISWSFIFQRIKVYRFARDQIKNFEEQFWSGADLTRLYEVMTSRGVQNTGMSKIFVAGFREYLRLRQQSGIEPAAVMQGTERAMRIAIDKESDQLETHLSYLATVGSVSPYIGLFGTVWGIMHSFMSLGSVQQATLNMVAPGIAEALVATAMGLFAAIPAVVAYNRFTRSLERLLSKYEIFQEEFSNILHRQAHTKSAKSV